MQNIQACQKPAQKNGNQQTTVHSQIAGDGSQHTWPRRDSIVIASAFMLAALLIRTNICCCQQHQQGLGPGLCRRVHCYQKPTFCVPHTACDPALHAPWSPSSRRWWPRFLMQISSAITSIDTLVMKVSACVIAARNQHNDVCWGAVFQISYQLEHPGRGSKQNLVHARQRRGVGRTSASAIT
jgi:hypothetical protein